MSLNPQSFEELVDSELFRLVVEVAPDDEGGSQYDTLEEQQEAIATAQSSAKSVIIAAHEAKLKAELEAWYEMWEASEYAPKIRAATKKNMQTRIAALTNPQEGR